MIFSVLTSKIAMGACVALALALAVAGWRISWLTASIEKPLTGWKARLATSELALHDCHNNQLALQSSLDNQNHAVDALRSESDARTADAARRLSQARSDALQAQTRVGAIMAAQPGENVCDSALALVRSAGR